MGRTRDYDEQVVLAGAMHAFRRSGYEGASIRDLEQATGLKAGSIYNSYGDKAGLFDAAFDHYIDRVLLGRIDRFAPPDRGLRGLRQLFLSLLSEPGGGSFGCLITNSAVELGGRGRMHPSVQRGLKILQATFFDRLSAESALGRMERSAAPDVVATKLLALYQGILVLIRAGHQRASVERLINHEFDHLEKHS